MNADEAKEFLKDRGIPTMNYPHGYILKVSRREGSPSRRIEMDELDAILALGKVKLIAVEDTVGDVLIEVERKDLIRD
jgi:hypothetical protein